MPIFDLPAVASLSLGADVLLMWLACLTSGAATGVGIRWLLSALRADDLQQDDEWRYDVSRIQALRRLDVLYRLFQVVIQGLARVNRAALSGRLPEIQRQIRAAGLSRFWLAEEYLGRMQLIALMLFPAYLYLCAGNVGVGGIALAVAWFLLTIWFLRRRLAQAAGRRLTLIKRRMPYFLDLMTLLMEAGASFWDALKQSVEEFEGHAISVEFGRVLTDMNMGKTRREAFHNLRGRLNDQEMDNIVGSIIQSEELGTPLAEVFRTQSDVLRVKRSQRAETIAAEAGVRMLLPGVLIMAAAVLIILGPFMLNYLHFGL
ncbi:MAG: type II secretion system F family protein [Pirellulaceae bacterium]